VVYVNFSFLKIAHSLVNKFLYVLYFTVQIIIRDVVFPLLCHSNEDEQLWNSDPIEYIRTKYGQKEIVLVFKTVI